MTGFPEGFLWGAATAGHQIEGGNVNSDCWVLEHVPSTIFREPSLDVVDHYHRSAEDVALLAGLGLNAFRLGIEWSRIEPEEGHFSRAALDHYRRVLATCHEHGITTVVTYSHWTTPIWFAADGGWTNPKAVDRFSRFVETAAAHLGDEIDWACTLNEPNVGSLGVGGGVGAASRGNLRDAIAEATALHPGPSGLGFRGLMLWGGDQLGIYTAAHRRAVDIIRSGPGQAPVGWTLATEDYQPQPGGEEREAAIRAKALDPWFEVSRDDDFVGVQNYTRRRVGPDGVLPPPDGALTNDLGWELHPPSLANVVRRAHAQTGVPVLVTEHGLASSDDDARIAFTRASLEHLPAVLADGIPLLGYLHWTLLDEFEWFHGYSTTFGLIEVDRTTFERTPRPSAEWLGRVAKANGMVD